MAILVDECVWQHRDRTWCHMVSDTSLDELHEFARGLGVPERGFHGDHYDLPSHVREMAVERGAQPVTSRELVRAIAAIGLRATAAQRRSHLNGTDVGQGSGAPMTTRGQ